MLEHQRQWIAKARIGARNRQRANAEEITWLAGEGHSCGHDDKPGFRTPKPRFNNALNDGLIASAGRAFADRQITTSNGKGLNDVPKFRVCDKKAYGSKEPTSNSAGGASADFSPARLMEGG